MDQNLLLDGKREPEVKPPDGTAGLDLFTKCRIEAVMDGYIATKVPRHVRDLVRLVYEWKENLLTLYEERPSGHRYTWERTGIVRFELARYKWSVYARDEEDKWKRVDCIDPAEDFERQLELVEQDNTGLFWK
ncbi:DUF3024 domain-containing protein [Paenibacillus pinihumi]|uniref:DUF3024 domain-containing protein n=1 Tax=Paenibacillus pinihumi TaxID=669462 RepID=UPI000403FFB9|nr:DUF3024 domain-containing protein [Paenibacillus pinihumi]